ncbi:hypothetical protein [Salmonella phage SD-1_S14]|nr:hypothetical protein [Salmonella phage SD-1_S14]
MKYNDIKYWVDPYLNKSLLMYTACIIQNNY